MKRTSRGECEKNQFHLQFIDITTQSIVLMKCQLLLCSEFACVFLICDTLAKYII